MRRQLLPALLLLPLALVATSASAVHVRISTGEGIEIDNDTVVITPRGEARAEISARGDLRIDGRPVALDDHDRQMLQRYNRKLHSIQAHAIEIGIEGASIGIGALAYVAVALVTGDRDAVERHVEPRAERLEEKAQHLCHEVRSLQRLQDRIADEVPAFVPYALMDEDDAADCHVD
jgi:hypothetical protein